VSALGCQLDKILGSFTIPAAFKRTPTNAWSPRASDLNKGDRIDEVRTIVVGVEHQVHIGQVFYKSSHHTGSSVSLPLAVVAPSLSGVWNLRRSANGHARHLDLTMRCSAF
jgi:hypothetical protein